MNSKTKADTMTKTVVNPFLEGNFAPIHQEITADELKVIGDLPSDLSGNVRA
jgi:carotenoid cleavage dioxygenase